MYFVFDLSCEVIENAGMYENIFISVWQIIIIQNNSYLYISHSWCLVDYMYDLM